ncbi:MAG: phage portal protein [Clostridiales bacterium]|nr:phage portal protein [Candidatus Crickella merdequi]
MALHIEKVKGLTEAESKKLAQLLEVYNYHYMKNEEKAHYYDGHISLSEVNLGIALPRLFRGLEIGCTWGRKCVDVLASHSMFDGFVNTAGEPNELLDEICRKNNLIAEYNKATIDELKFGCTFATFSADEELKCKIRLHSPKTAAALWNGEKNRIDCGMAIIDTVSDEKDRDRFQPSVINLYTDDTIIVLRRNDTGWTAERHPHKMGRPLMVAFVWNATSDKPFGSSRIKEPIRRLIQGYVRTLANATIALEFATSPQKYMMGASDEQFDAIVGDKFKQYVGSILVATNNPETGEKPTFGQLQQGHIAPHVEMLRSLATQFSAATGLTVADTGVVNDANPTSSEAIIAQSQTLILMAEQLNASNGDTLRTIAQMALAIAKRVTLDELDEEDLSVIPHFKNPAMPSVASTADAAIKVATSRPAFADTDTFLEMIGFSQADIRRIKAQEQRVRGSKLLAEEFADEDITE